MTTNKSGSSPGASSPATTTISAVVSEDYYQGNAQFVILADGVQVGGVQTATAPHADGAWQTVTVSAALASAPSTVAVEFLNDAWGGSSSLDRNLYLQTLIVNGTSFAGTSGVNTAGGLDSGNAAALFSDGSVTFAVGSAPPPPPPPPPPAEDTTITVSVSEDYYQGNAQFVVLADGVQVGGVQTASALHSQGAFQNITVSANLASPPTTVAVEFLNDAWGGSSALDRNLYVQTLTVNGTSYAGSAGVNTAHGTSVGGVASLFTDGALTFAVGAVPPPPPPPVAPPSPALDFMANEYLNAGTAEDYNSNQAWSVGTDIDVAQAAPGPGYNLPQGGAELIFGDTNGYPYQGYELWIDEHGLLRVRIMSNFIDGAYIDVESTTDVADGKPHFIGASYDGSGKAAGVSLYMDGAKLSTATISDTLNGSTVSGGPLVIGNQLNGWQNQFELAGRMSDFFLSNTDRPAAYFQPGTAQKTIDGSTQIAYEFNAGSGTTVADLSGHMNTGTLSTSALWVT